MYLVNTSFKKAAVLTVEADGGELSGFVLLLSLFLRCLILRNRSNQLFAYGLVLRLLSDVETNEAIYEKKSDVQFSEIFMESQVETDEELTLACSAS